MSRIPRVLALRPVVPPRVLLITVAVSIALLIAAVIMGFPLWAIAVVTLFPWIPICCFEALWQYDHYGFYAVFGAIVLLQLGHMGEHVAQLIQLTLTHGNLAQSHGIFGQLDMETVHFVWNVGVWLGACLLFYRFGSRNPWLWVALAAASVHMVEHFYLYWLYIFHVEYWAAGGSAGILAKGGMLSSPLARPYLHFAYNFLEITPLVVAFWDQTRMVYDQYLVRALPGLSEANLIAATAQLKRVKVAPGVIISRWEDLADHVYIVSKGEVEVVEAQRPEAERIALLQPGQFFGERGSLLTERPTAAVRATRPTELLALDRATFSRLIANSTERPQDPEGGQET